MTNSVFITRIVLRNYKSIGACDVKLGAMTFLVGANGSGKSNFLDALHLVRDALAVSLDNALSERGGLAEVRRRSSGHPKHLGVRLEFVFKDGTRGHYAFNIGALKDRGYEVQKEECVVGAHGFIVARGAVIKNSGEIFPAVSTDRLALVAASGMAAYRPLYDALTAMGFYNLNPKHMREPQKPQEGRFLKPVGENITSVVAHLERVAPDQMSRITEYLHAVVPMVHGVERKQIGPMETLEFRQDMIGAKHPWRFFAQNMSDGTLRALGVLVALFQGNRNYAPTLVGIEEPETALHPAAGSALREALLRASTQSQVIVTSHSPDLLDHPDLPSDSVLAVVSEGGETKVGPLDTASYEAIRTKLYSAGELLRLNQLAPNRDFLKAQQDNQRDLFGDAVQ